MHVQIGSHNFLPGVEALFFGYGSGWTCVCARTPTLYPYPWFSIGLGPDGWLFLQVAPQDGLPAESVPSFPGTGAAECD